MLFRWIMHVRNGAGSGGILWIKIREVSHLNFCPHKCAVRFTYTRYYLHLSEVKYKNMYLLRKINTIN